MFGKLLKALAPVEIVDRNHDGIALGLGVGMTDYFLQSAFRNIDGSLHASILEQFGFPKRRKGIKKPRRWTPFWRDRLKNGPYDRLGGGQHTQPLVGAVESSQAVRKFLWEVP